MKLITIFFTLLVSSSVSACSFTQDADIFKAAEDNYSAYQQVLAVTVSGVTEADENLDRTYTLQVHKNYKGSTGQEIMIRAAGHSCGFFGSVGQHFLWMTNSLDEISEGTPKYFYDSVEKMLQENDGRFTKNNSLPNGACTKEYRPVCADLEVQCVQAPCYPIRGTYANTCVAESQGAVIVSEGECSYEGPVENEENTQEAVDPGFEPFKTDDQAGASNNEEVVNPGFDPALGNNGVISPKKGPLDGFVEPTTPPPVREVREDESAVENNSWLQNMWVTFSTWISGLFAK